MNNKNNTCPLCKGTNISKLERIHVTDLNNIYLTNYQIDTSHLFTSDTIDFCMCEDCALKFFEPSAIGDEGFYAALQKMDLYYMEDKEEYNIAANYILPSHDILDVGCGKGAFSKKVFCNSFTGLEYSNSAKKMGDQDGVNIINESIQEHSIHNKDKYHAVCTFQVLEHVETNILFDFIKAMVDCIKTNGLLIISVPSDDSFISKGVNSALNMPPHHQTRWPDRTLKEIAQIFNLDIVDLHHDKLADRNKDEYLYLNINHILSRNHQIVTTTVPIMQKIIQKASVSAVHLMGNKLKDTLIDRMKPYGHSVTAVYKKSYVG
ncbi:methyltransferase domain-containing protein [Chryseolinea sp. H1M3-3]|uniref:class I SAM-dependent methyltransferase n=1 Tax=Chryseolinea sp. H1M3-3 TaxID=3034144 RepID=UPI0023ED6FF1|nr:methyltransferase domain-containing protein [Chryseolinea sp. H1M3-3]